MEKLLDQGALDAFAVPVQMKKQRPGTLVTVLCRPRDKDRFLDLIFRESTTFGVREFPVSRTVLSRKSITVSTPYGDVRVKAGSWRGETVTCSPEMDDCIERARAQNVPVREVYEAAQRAATAWRDKGR
jgi:uncharacterized protein (DUF111 family)